MEELGIISGSYIKIDQENLGYTTQAFIGVFLDKTTHHKEALAMLEKYQKLSHITIQL